MKPFSDFTKWTLLVMAALWLGACLKQRPQSSQLEEVSRAALRLQSSVTIGSYKPTPESLNDLAGSINVAKRLKLGPLDTAAIADYEAALNLFLQFNEVWEVGYKFRSCEAELITGNPKSIPAARSSCFASYEKKVRAASTHSGLSLEEVEQKRPDVLLRRASDEIEKAEKERRQP